MNLGPWKKGSSSPEGKVSPASRVHAGVLIDVQGLMHNCTPEGPGTLLLRNHGLKTMYVLDFAP